MSDSSRPLATFHDGAVVPDFYKPVTADSTPIGDRCVCLRIGTGGGNITVGFVLDDGLAQATFKNVANGEVLVGRFYNVSAVTGPVADILAGIV